MRKIILRHNPAQVKNLSPPGTPLCIEKPTDKIEAAPRIPKGVLKRSGHNPNARATKNYSVVEDLGHTPCAMSALEVLQSFPSQRKALLSALGVNGDDSSSVIKFETHVISLACPTMCRFWYT